jgi:ATP-dependent helicase HrpB
MIPLPIDEHLPTVIGALTNGPCVAVRAPTGAGKTTRIPPALFNAGLAAGKQVLLLQPRRIAARAAAVRMAAEQGSALGTVVGYEVRFDRRSSAATKILAVTDGIFLRMLQADPLLEQVGIVVFDEFHERNLNCDLALAICRQVQSTVRPDLKIVVMSATLPAQAVATYLGNCPVIESEGRLFPIETKYLDHASNDSIAVLASAAVERLLAQTRGDLLVFLPGVGEIRRTAESLQSLAESHDLNLQELYGDLPLELQQAVLAPSARRKIVLSTNVAETSLTIEGINGVVDSGWARVLRRDPNLGINRLELERISQASADQRAGRAGRMESGVCLRLWTRSQQQHLPKFDQPEIRRADLTACILEILAWGEPDPTALPWFEPPLPESVEQAVQLLRTLGAVDEQGITELGHLMARFPVHPRIARVLIEGGRLGQPKRAALAAAILSERDVFERPPFISRRDRSQGFASRVNSNSDVLDRVEALEEFANSGRTQFEIGRLNTSAARFAVRAAEQLLRVLDGVRNFDGQGKGVTRNDATADEAILRVVAVGYLDRLAKRRKPNERRALLQGGRGVRLLESSAVTTGDLFACVEIEETGAAEANVRLASIVERDWIASDLITSQTQVVFDSQRERVIGLRTTSVGDLVIDEAPTSIPDDVDVSEILAEAARKALDVNSLLDDVSRQLIARVQFLRQHMPEQSWPDWGDGLAAELLPSLCAGCTSFAELRKASATGALISQLTSQQEAALAREAPEQTTVPSGSRITLQYENAKPPVLAVRIQEVFGWRETPRVAGGRVPVVLHLLGPNYRPQQVTSDLASFWRTAYSEVRKELRRRYPKHSWPDDPLTAVAERRPQRKRS